MYPTRTAADFRARSAALRDRIIALKADISRKKTYTKRDVALGRELMQQVVDLLDEMETAPMDPENHEAIYARLEKLAEVME